MRISKIILWSLGLWLSLSVAGQAEVVQNGLPKLNIGTIGIETGLTADVFGKNTDAQHIIRQINQSADMEFNPQEREILKKILMTDVSGNPALEKENEAYLRARLNALLKQGLFDDALILMNKIPAKDLTKEIKRFQSEALFAKGSVQKACQENLLESFKEEEAFMRVVCADTISVPPMSALAYEVYRESGRDTHPFLNAAGEVLYRNLAPALPEGKPSVFEMPMMAKAYGAEVLEQPLSREQLLVLVNNETVPNEVRLKAKNRLNQSPKTETDDGSVLDDLLVWARLRPKIQKFFRMYPVGEEKRVGPD